MEFWLARVKLVLLARTAPLVKATKRARSAEVTVVLRLVSEKPAAPEKLPLDSLERSGLAAWQSDRLAQVSFAPARQRSVPSHG
jgi:hypothetical protein